MAKPADPTKGASRSNFDSRRRPPTSAEIAKSFVEKKLATRFAELVALGERPGTEAAQERGRAFERLLHDLLDAHGLLLRTSYTTVDGIEQIDGAIELGGRVALVEAKWKESGLAASELFAFLGKVEGKFVGTIGVFVSYTELKSHFLTALRAGRRQSILVVHGPNDLARLFEETFPLGDYLVASVHHVSIDNLPHLSTVSFASERERVVRADEEEDAKADLRDLLTRLGASGASPAGLASVEEVAHLATNIQGLIRVFPKVLGQRSMEPLRGNIPTYIQTALKRLPEEELPMDTEFFKQIFPATLLEPGYLPLISALSARLPFVAGETRQAVDDVLIAAWKEHLGTYEKENVLAPVTDALWMRIGESPKRQLLASFIHIVNSDRRRHFPQVRLAERMFKDEANAVLRDEVLRDLVKQELLEMLKRDKRLSWAREWIDHSFENTIRLAPSHAKTIIDRVQSELQMTGLYESASSATS